MIEEHIERFEKHFGIRSLPGEPLAFDASKFGDRPLPLDPTLIMKQLVDALRKNGASGALLYAVEKTDLLLTAETYAAAPRHRAGMGHRSCRVSSQRPRTVS